MAGNASQLFSPKQSRLLITGGAGNYTHNPGRSCPSRCLRFYGKRRITVVMTTNFDPSIGASTQWKKGQRSPNPGGRPKSRLLSEALRVRLEEVNPDDPQARTFA